MGASPLVLAKSIYYLINTVKGLNPGVITFQLILAVSNITTTVAPSPIDGSAERRQIASFIFGL